MHTSLFVASTELQLTELRAALARQLGIEPAKVWSSKAMQEILKVQPRSLAELQTVKGLSKKKVAEFGQQILLVFGGQAAALEEPAALAETADRIDEPAEKVFGVGDYLDYVNHILKVAEDIKVIGEISRISNHPTGVYLTLKDKDGDGVLDCYINPYTYRGLGMILEEGMEVKVGGTPGIFKRRSQLSMKVETVELAGEGTLKKAYELLKQKLEQEGMFDRKREIPEFIGSIGLITSKTGAVIDDFRKNLEQLGFRLYLKDCRVEGNQAAGQIIRAIKYFSIEQPNLDCLVVMRGGGSLEDMQAFNSEAVVKEVFASRIPVIAALGHDRDVPLACLAADTYTSTPTAAAMLINATWQRLKQETPQYEQILVHKFQSALDVQNSQLSGLMHQLTGSFNTVLQRFKHLEEKVLRGYTQIINAIHQTKQQAQAIMIQLVQHVARNIQYAADTTLNTEKLLLAASPERNLRLGYSLAYDAQGRLVRSKSQAKPGDNLRIKLGDGDINTEVI